MIDELKPCPFCGGTDIGDDHVTTYSVDSSYDVFGCRSCGARFENGSETEWNRRAPQPPAEAQRCTCPSGDGSLRWPCPAHPAEAQAVGEAVVWLNPDCEFGEPFSNVQTKRHTVPLYAAPPSAPVGVEALLADLETIWHSVSDDKETNAAYERLKIALAGQQPAAETPADGLVREAYEWLFESKSDGPRVSQGALDNGSYTREFHELHDRFARYFSSTAGKQPAACDMGELCIGCEPRNADGSCPDQHPAACVGCEGKPAPENAPCAVCGQQPAAVDDDTLESLIEESDGHWSEDEFRIEGPDLMRLLRDAALAAKQGGRSDD